MGKKEKNAYIWARSTAGIRIVEEKTATKRVFEDRSSIKNLLKGQSSWGFLEFFRKAGVKGWALFKSGGGGKELERRM